VNVLPSCELNRGIIGQDLPTDEALCEFAGSHRSAPAGRVLRPAGSRSCLTPDRKRWDW